MKLNDVLKYRAAIEAGSSAVARTDEEALQVCGLYPRWAEGKHTRGEIYNAEEQTWECYQDYDNAVYPDIKPGNAAWYTFNRPLHGKTRKTARAWVQPTGAHDMYRAGEWMIWTDGGYCECIAESGTSFSPEEYTGGWRKEA